MQLFTGLDSNIFIDETISYLKNKLKNDTVILGLSGGVDSTVAAILLHHAIGENLHCIFVDNGLLRKGEFDEVLNQYKDMGLNVVGVDASNNFYKSLKGICEPEKSGNVLEKLLLMFLITRQIKLRT